MTFTLLTQYSDFYDPVASITLPNRQVYCDKHGYNHVVQRGPFHDASLYYAIDRLYLLIDLMTRPHASDFYWVFNIPGMIMNHNRRLEEFVDDTHDFFIHRDVNALNAGSFIVRNSEWGRKWIEFLIEDTKTHSHEWFENYSILRHAETDVWKAKVKVVPHPGFNSYDYPTNYNMPADTVGNWNPGDFVISLPGMDVGKRLVYLQSDLVQKGVIT